MSESSELIRRTKDACDLQTRRKKGDRDETARRVRMMISEDDLLPICVPENAREILEKYKRQRERIAELEAAEKKAFWNGFERATMTGSRDIQTAWMDYKALQDSTEGAGDE
jgi:hypothetical protein